MVAKMPQVTWFQKLQIRHFSKPASDRPLLVHLLDHPVRSILEIGIGNGERTQRVIDLAHLPSDVAQLRYCGVDPFESAPEGRAHLKLKQAHRLLSERGVKAHLVPGELHASLMRVTHTVQPSELVIIDHGYGVHSELGQALNQWLPRLATEDAVIFARAQSTDTLQRVSIDRGQVAVRKAA